MRILHILIALALSLPACADDGLVGHWKMEEGSGELLKDSSGNGNHGTIHGAQWAKLESGYALVLDGRDDYVDCGNGPSLDLRDTVSLEAWVSPERGPGEPGIVGKCFSSYALTYYGGLAYWYISSGGNNCAMALDQPAGTWYHIAGTFDGKEMCLYVDGKLVVRRPSNFNSINRSGRLYIGCILGETATGTPSPQNANFLKGKVADVRVYSRALEGSEIQRHYKEFAGNAGKDTTWLDRVKLTLYPYFSQGKVLVNADLGGFMPLPSDVVITLRMSREGTSETLSEKRFDPVPDTKNVEAEFSVEDLQKGSYSVQALVTSGGKTVSDEKVNFLYPPEAASVPAPSRSVVPSLPVPAKPIPYKVHVSNEGGFELSVAGRVIPVESLYSYPYGGENLLSMSRETGCEPAWQVSTRKIDSNTYEITAKGDYYSVRRQIDLHAHRVYVKDTLTNLRQQAVGIIVRNRFGTQGGGFEELLVAGYKTPSSSLCLMNPTVFASGNGLGVGMIALDDVYVVQCKGETDESASSLYTDSFALDAGASHTLEWAVYLNPTGDYYDFINAVRQDEGRNGVTVDGGFAFIAREGMPAQEFIDLRNMKYASLPCLSWSKDDPGISIEGIEFMDFPKEMEAIRKQFKEVRAGYPNLVTMFHIAHALYATDRPEERFPDSRVIDAEGRQTVYAGEAYYQNNIYFSKERIAEGWRWWLFYPTLENSFGKALLKSVDVMVDDLHCTGAFMDGFMGTYAGAFSYDGWDGHTADIDPETKTIARKKRSVFLASLPCLAEFADRMAAKGAVVIANGGIATRRLGSKKIICNAEITPSPQAHLWPTTLCLGDPSLSTNDVDLARDVRNKLKMGCLYFYYAETMTRRSAPAEMYPITIQEVRSGYVKGKERLVTLHSGVYGWRGNRDLHFCRLYDPRGMEVESRFITTVDASQVRTRLELGTDELAILKRIPVNLTTKAPVNLIAEKYDPGGIRLILNGKGKVNISVQNGDFQVCPGQAYRVDTGSVRTIKAGGNGRLEIPLELSGRTTLSVTAQEGQ